MSIIRPILVASLAALLSTGCLGTPEGRSCDDLPPGAEGCPAADGAVADRGPTVDLDPPDRGADAAPDDAGPPDGARPDAARDMALTDGAAPDMGPTPDMWAGDLGPDAAPQECEPGTARPCGNDVGACQAGQQFCNADGVYDACLGAVGPAEEACNGQDDDCNGETDEGCDCVDGTDQPCGSGEGECEQGVQRCVDGAWGACEGAVDGTEEVCDGLDNDCNGAIDDLPAIVNAQMCSVGVGQCRASGPYTCDGSNDGQPVCLADSGPPRAESCNELDDDCDGSTDEDVPTNRSLLYGGRRAEERPAIVGFGEFHGVAWIDDGQVYFGLAQGDVWEVDPVSIGGFNGDDTIAVHLAMAPMPGVGFKVAVSYDGLGSGLTVLEIDSGGNERQDAYQIDVARTGPIDIAYQTGLGFAVAYERSNAAAGTTVIDVELLREIANARPVRTTLSAAQNSYRQPQIVLVDGVPVVAAVRTDGRSSEGEIVLAPMGDGSRLRGEMVISGRQTARNPALRYLSQRSQYVAAWDESGALVPQNRAVRVTLVSNLGAAVNNVLMPVESSAVRPALVPISDGRNAADRLAVTWERSSEVGFNIDLGWLVHDGARWVVSPGVLRAFGEQGSTTGSSVAYARDGEGIAVVLTYDDGRNSSAVVSSLPGACPQQP